MEKEKTFKEGDTAWYEMQPKVFWKVKVLEAKEAYGKKRYVVEPVGGGDKITTEKLSDK